MPVPVKINPNYTIQSTLITDKYNPLILDKKIFMALDADEVNEITNICSTRLSVLKAFGTGLSKVVFYCSKSKDELIRNENSKSEPPIAVLSSGRSAFLTKCLSETNYETPPVDVADKTVFKDKNTKAQSSLWYDPRRVNGTSITAGSDKNVYVFVHFTEYETYKFIDDISGMTLVGWTASNQNVPIKERRLDLVGFGASRFMVLEFFQYIFNNTVTTAPTANTKADRRIWLADDDLAYVKGFSTFDKIQKGAETKKLAGMGFMGTTEKTSVKDISQKIQRSEAITEVVFEKGFVQQVVLWDLEKIKPYCFSPIFFTGKEDSSFNNYLIEKVKLSVQVVTRTGVMKLESGVSNPNQHLSDMKKELRLIFQEQSKTFQVKDEGNETIDLLKLLTQTTDITADAKSLESMDSIFSKALEQIMDMLIHIKATESEFTNTFSFPIKIGAQGTVAFQLFKTK